MKKSITGKDLSQLSENGRKNLENYLSSIRRLGTYASEPLMNIGDMIEFLDEEMEIGRHTKISTVQFFFSGKEYEAIEICDALWKATKDKLESKKAKKIPIIINNTPSECSACGAYLSIRNKGKGVETFCNKRNCILYLKKQKA